MANWSQAVWILENLKKILNSQTKNIIESSTTPYVAIGTSGKDLNITPKAGDICLIAK